MACVASISIVSAQASPVPKDVIGIWDEVATPDASGPSERVNVNAPKGGVLHAGAIGTFDSFNPFAPKGMIASFLSLTYETLAVSVGRDEYVMRGVLAESFEISNDRKTLDVHLRKEAKFSDGHPVRAEDVVFSFNALTQKASPTYRNYYQQVEKAEALDDLTVRFTFKDTKNRELALIVTELPVLPQHWWKDKDIGSAQKSPMPGSGPYVVSQYKMGQSIVFKRNPDWWGASLSINRGRYNFDEIKIDYYRDLSVMREAFFAGNIDYYVESTIKDWKLGYDVPSVQNGNIRKAEIPMHKMVGMSGIFINTRRPVLEDKRVRQALTEMFNFERLNKTLFFDTYRRCNSFFTGSAFAAKDPMSEPEKALLSSLPGIVPKDYEKLPVLFKAPAQNGAQLPRSQIKKALDLLSQAGWHLKNGQLQNKQGAFPTLSILMYSTASERVYSNWAKDLKRIGIELRMEVVDPTQFVNRLRNFDFDLVMGMVHQSYNPGNEQRYYWSSAAASEKGSRNFAGIRLPAVDRLIEAIVAPKNKEDLITSVKVLDRVLREGYYVIPGWYSPTARVAWWQKKITPPSQGLKSAQGFDLLSWYAVNPNKDK